MNITRFINSRDIGKYLRESRHHFSAPEAAFTVFQSREATLDEKVAAWNEIIETMPTCSMGERLNLEAIPDFAQFLRAYVALQQRCVERFMQPDGAVFVTGSCTENQTVTTYGLRAFSTFEQCRQAFLAEIKELEGCGAYSPRDWFEIVKCPLNKHEEQPEQSCRINCRGDVLLTRGCERTDEELRLSLAFDGMWFDIPTPFHAGDIVCSTKEPDDPFVLTDLAPWDEQRCREELPAGALPERFFEHLDYRVSRMRASGDASDMSASGFIVSQSGALVWNERYDLSTYLDLELYRAPLDAEHAVLQVVSDYLKRNADIEFLLNAQLQLRQQAMRDEMLKELRGRYLAEGLALVGIADCDGQTPIGSGEQ